MRTTPSTTPNITKNLFMPTDYDEGEIMQPLPPLKIPDLIETSKQGTGRDYHDDDDDGDDDDNDVSISSSSSTRLAQQLPDIPPLLAALLLLLAPPPNPLKLSRSPLPTLPRSRHPPHLGG
jgi:hypothetical protein